MGVDWNLKRIVRNVGKFEALQNSNNGDDTNVEILNFT